jgi:hypothetical protein
MVNLKHFIFKNEHRLLGLVLFCLLFASNLAADSPFVQVFLFIHFGLFLLWQQGINQHFIFSWQHLLILFIIILSFIYWYNPWLNAFWFLLLQTLLTGHIFARGWSRAVYGFAVIVLFLDFTLIIIPSLFNLIAIDSSLQTPVKILLTSLILLLLFTPKTSNHFKKIDIVRGFLIVFLVTFLSISSVLISLLKQQSYILSLAVSTLILSLFLLIVAFLWLPRAGFSGMSVLLEKHLLNIGGAF